MKNIFKTGDTKIFVKEVSEADFVYFENKLLHKVYSTYALGRDMEWSSRLFVLEMKEDDEEGIGTFLNIKHIAPALLGEKVTITATIDKIEKNNVECSIEVVRNNQLIATGKTGQKILKKDKLNLIFELR